MPDIIGGIKSTIETEIDQYLHGFVSVAENPEYSQAKLVRRISLFESQVYPTGKFDSQGNYKYWFDIQTARITAEIKNVDFDTKDIKVYSERKVDELPTLIVNLKMKEWLRENGQADEINSAIEEGAGWGNIVWKKIKGGYERADLKNFYVINQTAECLDESPVIERHQLTQSDLREKIGVWDMVEDTIKDCGTDSYAQTIETQSKNTTMPYYEIFERNGEVSVAHLKEAKGQAAADGDDKKYELAKVVVAAVKGQNGRLNIKYILFADTITEMPYKEYHRSVYKGRWFREGIVELLFDLQVRANQIGNQLAQGLEWASKTVFTTAEKTIVNNVLTDLSNGDIIRAQNLQQLPVRMEGLDQLANEWNRIMQMADSVSNSNSIVQGDRLPMGTSFRLAAMLNQNANKIFDFMREKLAIPMTEIFEEWIVPQLVKELKAKDVLRLTGDSDMLERLYELIVDDWYLNNLVEIGPHDQMFADNLKAEKLDEVKNRPQLLMTELQGVFDGFAPHVSIVITGENSTLDEDLKTLSDFIALEQDPVRRSAMIEIAMKKKGIDVASLPKSENGIMPGLPGMTPQMPGQPPTLNAQQPVASEQMPPMRVAQKVASPR